MITTICDKEKKQYKEHKFDRLKCSSEFGITTLQCTVWKMDIHFELWERLYLIV